MFRHLDRDRSRVRHKTNLPCTCLNREGLQNGGGARGTGGPAAPAHGRRRLFWPGVGRPARPRARRVPRGRRASGALRARAPVGCRAGVGRRAPIWPPPAAPCVQGRASRERSPNRFCVAHPWPRASASFFRRGNLVCRAVSICVVVVEFDWGSELDGIIMATDQCFGFSICCHLYFFFFLVFCSSLP